MEETYMPSASVPLAKPSKLTLATLGYSFVAVTAFLLPFFFVPSSAVAVDTAKIILLSVGVLAGFFAFLLNIIKRGEFEFPKHKLFLGVLAVPLVFLLSAFLSSNRGMSLFGYGLEAGTWAFVTLGFVLLFLTSMLFQSKSRVYYSYLGFLAGFVLILIVALAKLFLGPDALSFGILNGEVGNTVGFWTDLATYFGISAVLLVMALEMLTLKRGFKVLLSVLLALSMFVLAVLNFSTVWILLLIFSLVFFVYTLSSNNGAESDERRISYPALALLIVSVIFTFNTMLFGEGNLSTFITSTFNISGFDVRPSIAATGDIIKSTLKTSPLVGSGPGTFGSQWLLHKPSGVNLSEFWNVNFPYGFGLLPTFAATTGVLGLLAWAFFLFFYVKLGVKALFADISSSISKFLVASSFLASVFLWVMVAVYTPRVTIFALAFFMSGLFIAALMSEGLVEKKVVNFGRNAKLGFLSVIVLVALLIGNVAFAYTALQRSASNIYFQKAALGFNGENIDEAIAGLNRAVSLAPYDVYYRTLSQAYIIKLNNVLADSALSDEAKGKAFQELLAATITSAQSAISANSDDYQNWLALGQIYESIVPPPFSIEGSYDSAKSAYLEAEKRNPQSPEVYLVLARLEALSKNNVQAREYINQAITRKQNYADAYFLLTQIELAENNLKQAIESAEVLVLLTPNNAGIYFQLGLLKYNNNDFTGAAQALAQAVSLVPDYANAKYFLGLSLNKLNEKDLALAQFKDLIRTNPDNAELPLIMANIEKGDDPFKGFPSGETKPERGSEPPLREGN